MTSGSRELKPLVLVATNLLFVATVVFTPSGAELLLPLVVGSLRPLTANAPHPTVAGGQVPPTAETLVIAIAGLLAPLAAETLL